MIKITKSLAITALKAAVEAKGKDYTDPAAIEAECQYAKGKKPGCIIGHALNYLGVPVKTLKKLDEIGDSRILRLSKENVLSAYDIELTPAALEAFSAAQYRQDLGHTWGKALESAKASRAGVPLFSMLG